MSKGKRIGYIRVSTTDQNPERQLENIQVDKKFIEYASGSSMKRPQLELMIDYVREDDLVIIHSIDRLARNVRNLHEIIDQLLSKGVSVKFIKEGLSFNGNDSAMSKLILGIFGHVAEFERELLLERQKEGIAIAKKRGKYKGRQTRFTNDIQEQIKVRLQTRDSKSRIAQDLGISRFTLYRYLEKLKKDDIILESI